MNQFDVVLIIKVFAVSFSVTALYVLIANSIVYFVVGKNMDAATRELMKRFLFKLPLIMNVYGFTAGLVAYIGVFLLSPLLGGNSSRNTLAVSAHPGTALVFFTLCGACLGTFVGLSIFIKAKRALSIGLKKV
jgi:hypothetical protein